MKSSSLILTNKSCSHVVLEFLFSIHTYSYHLLRFHHILLLFTNLSLCFSSYFDRKRWTKATIFRASFIGTILSLSLLGLSCLCLTSLKYHKVSRYYRPKTIAVDNIYTPYHCFLRGITCTLFDQAQIDLNLFRGFYFCGIVKV